MPDTDDVADETSDPNAHTCEFNWCETNNTSNDHWWLQYTPATGREFDPMVGVGVNYYEGDLPEVVVHLDGGRVEADVDAHLRLDEAIELRDLLDRAITYARTATVEWAKKVVAEHG